jgi:hypothetical protein
MFGEIEELVRDLRTFTRKAKSLAESAGRYFHAFALAQAYNHLIALADERTQQHPEVQRVPELRLVLLNHLMTNADRHIDLSTNRIFLATLLGSPQTLANWQEAGYHTARTKSNYPARLRYWRAIYDEAPVIYQHQVRSNNNALFSEGRTYQSSFLSSKGKAQKPEVSYEDVIRARNENYGEIANIVPWWTALNYGTNTGGNAGYPSVPGLHFVEDAEREVPNFLSRAVDNIDRFMGSVIDDDVIRASDQSAIEYWAARNISTAGVEYLPSADLARIISFGVPF